MAGKSDRSILKVTSLDQTRCDTECISDILLRTQSKKKKRVSFSQTIAIKAIERVRKQCSEVENVNSGSPNQENIRAASDQGDVIGITPKQQKSIFKTYQKWSLNEDAARLSIDSCIDDSEEESNFPRGPLKSKPTANRHKSFFVDPEETENMADELAFQAAEMTILNATVAPQPITTTALLNQSVNPLDDFSRFLASDEAVNEVDMDFSVLPTPNSVPCATSTAIVSLPALISSPSQNPPANIHEDIMDLSELPSRDLSLEGALCAIPSNKSVGRSTNVSIASSLPPVAKTYVIDQNVSQNLNQSCHGQQSRPNTYTVIKDQSTIDEARDGAFGLAEFDESWSGPPEEVGGLSSFNQSRLSAVSTASKATNLSGINLQPPIPPHPGDEFNSPLRKGRRRTFVHINRSQEREQRREMLLRGRSSFEPVNKANSSLCQQNSSGLLEQKLTGNRKGVHSQHSMLPEPEPEQQVIVQESQSSQKQQSAYSLRQQNSSGLLEQKLTGNRKDIHSQHSVLPEPEPEQQVIVQESQSSQKQQSAYKYVLPELKKTTDPSVFVQEFDSGKLEIGLFSKILTNTIAECQEKAAQQHEEERQMRKETLSEAPKSTEELPKVFSPSCNWNRSFVNEIDFTLSTPKTPSLEAITFENKALSDLENTLLHRMEALKLKATKTCQFERLLSEKSEECPELLNELPSNVTFRFIKETGCSFWHLPGIPGTCHVEVIVFPVDDATSSLRMTIFPRKSPYGGAWLSKFGDIALEMINCRLGIDPRTLPHDRRFESKETADSFILKINQTVQSAVRFQQEMLTLITQQMFFDAEENFEIRYEQNDNGIRKPYLVAALSTFPILAILADGLDICAKVTIIVDLDLSTYPSVGSLKVVDQAIVEGGVSESSRVADIIQQFNEGVRSVVTETAKNPLTLRRLSDFLCTLKQN